MLNKRHRAGHLSKPCNAVVQIDLWETDHVTVEEPLVGSGALVANLLKGATVRLFKHPCQFLLAYLSTFPSIPSTKNKGTF